MLIVYRQLAYICCGRELFFVNPSSFELVAVQVSTDSGFQVLDQLTLFGIPISVLASEVGNFYDTTLGDEQFLMARVSAREYVLVQNFLAELPERAGN